MTTIVEKVCDGDCRTRTEHEQRFRTWQAQHRARFAAARRLPPLDGALGFDDLAGRDPMMTSTAA